MTADTPMASRPNAGKRRGPGSWVDRRILRSVIYGGALVVLFLLFKTSEWLIEHFISGNKNYGLLGALSLALALAVVFQLFHKRVEHTIERLLHRRMHEREQGIESLIQEIALIRERSALERRAIDRLDELLLTEGTSLYLNRSGENFQLAYSTSNAPIAEFTPDDPAIIHLRLQQRPLEPKTVGSHIAAPMIWPIHLRGRLAGFITSGDRRHKETFDDAEIRAVERLAKALGAALALFDSALAGDHLASGIARKDNLPQNLLPIIGRQAELSEVKALMETARLVTLIGTGGLGKTRFSLEIASALLGHFPDGVWFIEFAPVSDPALVSRTVAEVMGVHEEPGRPLIETLLEFLRRKNALLILDNCEHLVESCARFAEAVLRECGKLRLLASSREALGIVGEVAWRIPTLATADPKKGEGPDTLIQYPAVQLFIARALLASPSFRLTGETAAAVASICQQLDGIPLALELAAARVKSMRVEQIAERLNDRFHLLTGGNRTALPRQHTLRSAIDWSYDLLNEAERIVLRRLSVFAGGWTLEAAEAICAGDGVASDEILDLLARLVEKSLVLPDEHAAEPRYRMLETIRQYAKEKLLNAGEVGQLGKRHLTYFVEQAELFEPHFYCPDQVRWYARADAELDNFRVALEHSLSTPHLIDGMRIANALHRYWVARVYWREASSWMTRLLAVTAEQHSPWRARTLFAAGHITNYYDAVEARRFADESLRLAREIGDRQNVINALWVIGWMLHPKLDGSAVPYFEESIKLAREDGYTWGAMHAYAWYGMYRIGVGDYDGAKATLRDGIVQAERIGGDSSLIGRCEGNLGQVAMLQGDFGAARASLDKSLQLQKSAGNRNGIAESLWLQGRLALVQNDIGRARECLQQSLALYRDYTTSVWVSRGLAYIAISHIAKGEFGLAARLMGALAARDTAQETIEMHLGLRASIVEYHGAVESLRAKMPKSEFDAAWDAGRALGTEAAIDLALAG